MKELLNDIFHFSGNVLCIGVDNSKIISSLKKNKKIGLYELNRPEKRGLFARKKRIKTETGQSVKIKKFRTLFKKKSIDYLIINLNNVFDYYKYIASNSICICNKKIYIYGSSDYINAELIAKKFRRYETNIVCKQNKNNYLVVVECSKAKYNWLKDKFYLVIDTFHNLGDLISYFLTS